MAESVARKNRPAGRFKHWLLEECIEQVGGPKAKEGQPEPSPSPSCRASSVQPSSGKNG